MVTKKIVLFYFIFLLIYHLLMNVIFNIKYKLLSIYCDHMTFFFFYNVIYLMVKFIDFRRDQSERKKKQYLIFFS